MAVVGSRCTNGNQRSGPRQFAVALRETELRFCGSERAQKSKSQRASAFCKPSDPSRTLSFFCESRGSERLQKAVECAEGLQKTYQRSFLLPVRGKPERSCRVGPASGWSSRTNPDRHPGECRHTIWGWLSQSMSPCWEGPRTLLRLFGRGVPGTDKNVSRTEDEDGASELQLAQGDASFSSRLRGSE